MNGTIIINNMSFALCEQLDKSKIICIKAKKAGFVMKIAALAGRKDKLYWTKDPIVKYYDAPILWVQKPKYHRYCCHTTAFLYYNKAGLYKITCQVFGHEIPVMGMYYGFAKTCKTKMGDPEVKENDIMIWDCEKLIVRCKHSKKRKEAWFSFVYKAD